jgi:hypothetical protein
MEPEGFIGEPMNADDHGRRHVCFFDQAAPLRDFLTVTGEDDCFGRVRWDVDADLPSGVVVERFGDEAS